MPTVLQHLLTLAWIYTSHNCRTTLVKQLDFRGLQQAKLVPYMGAQQFWGLCFTTGCSWLAYAWILSHCIPGKLLQIWFFLTQRNASKTSQPVLLLHFKISTRLRPSFWLTLLTTHLQERQRPQQLQWYLFYRKPRTRYHLQKHTALVENAPHWNNFASFPANGSTACKRKPFQTVTQCHGHYTHSLPPPWRRRQDNSTGTAGLHLFPSGLRRTCIKKSSPHLDIGP